MNMKLASAAAIALLALVLQLGCTSLTVGAPPPGYSTIDGKDGPIYVRVPSPDVINTSLSTHLKATASKGKELLAIGGEVKAELLRLQQENPTLHVQDVMQYHLALVYANGGLTKADYSRLSVQLFESTLQQTNPTFDPKTSANREDKTANPPPNRGKAEPSNRTGSTETEAPSATSPQGDDAARSSQVEDPGTIVVLHFDNNSVTSDRRPPNSQLTFNPPWALTSDGKFGQSLLLGDPSGCQGNEAGWGSVGAELEIPQAWSFGGQDFTIDCWVKAVRLSGCDQHVWSFPGPGVEKLSLWITSAGAVAFRKQVSGNPDTVIAPLETDNGLVVAGYWHHIALVRKGSQFSLFVDGKLKGNKSRVEYPVVFSPCTSKLLLGVYWWDNVIKNYSHVQIDEFRIRLTAAWNKEFQVPTVPYLTN